MSWSAKSVCSPSSVSEKAIAMVKSVVKAVTATESAVPAIAVVKSVTKAVSKAAVSAAPEKTAIVVTSVVSDSCKEFVALLEVPNFVSV